jgi:hypothetical protein
MNRRVVLSVAFVFAGGFAFVGDPSAARAQSFTGKWVHHGQRGTSVLEFFPGEKRLIGPTRGAFHHTILLDDGRVIQGDGHYIYRHVTPNRGWLTLHFSDGHVTHEHEHTTSDLVLNLRHHGLTRTYLRQ